MVGAIATRGFPADARPFVRKLKKIAAEAPLTAYCDQIGADPVTADADTVGA
jgi:hypothetical protein